MTNTNGELRKFRAHEELLAKVIRDQTGGVDRAILEAVQNSIDAGAPEVYITTSLSRLSIADPGKGFASREEIVNNFETFGRPHEAREAKQFGAFRMGRGQLMPHGACSWTSNRWKMSVDLDKDGLAYRLEELEEAQPGCTVKVDLYRPLSNYDLTRLRADLKRDVKYVETKVFLDNERISQGAREGKWSVDGDWFVGHFNLTGDLHLYNVGVHVATWPNSKYGVGGTVVTNLAMRLNTARNDPKDDCPVWTEAKEAMLKERARLLEEIQAAGRPKKKSSSGKKTSTRKHLYVEERERRIRKIFAGDVGVESDDLSEPYFYAPTDNRKWVSALWLHKACSKHCEALRVVVAPRRHDLAVKANQFKLFYLIDHRNCSRTNTEPEALVNGLNRFFGSYHARLFKFLSHAEALETVARHVEVLERRKLTAQEEVLGTALTEHLPLSFYEKSHGYLGTRYHVGVFDNSVDQSPVRVLDGKERFDQKEIQVVLHKDRLVRLASIGLTGWLQLADTIVSQVVDRAAEIFKPESPQEWRAAKYHEAIQKFIRQGLLGLLHELADSQREGVEELKLSHARALDVLAMFDESGRSLDLWKSKLLEVKGELEKALRNNSLEGDPLALIAKERGVVLAADEN
ncbi:MAG: ATP-binding protein [Alphaproteobacteria bacterium]|nr:MAG: ATP-binding protein [Alphaproteobacteria bacterium]